MKLAILGGGGFRVPLVYGALLAEAGTQPVTEVALYDTDPARLVTIETVLAGQAAEHADAGGRAGHAPTVHATTDLDEALRGATFVFSAIRVGGLAGRTADERVALDHGLLGQETTGPGGIAYGLRTVPVAVRIAERVAAVCGDAWVINFTNPAGMVTEAMQAVLGDRVIGICDSPLGLARRAAGALGLDLDTVGIDYVGLNHLGWLRGLHAGGTDRLPDLLADPAALTSFEEGRLFGSDWLAALGALPNEYLYYYYFTREAVATMAGQRRTRGEFLAAQQADFYAGAGTDPAEALRRWRRTRAERDESYMADERAATGAGQRAEADLSAGGYEGVALALMAAIAAGRRDTMILNVRNGTTIAALPPDAVIEVVCAVDANGAHPLTCAPPTPHQLGLMSSVKAAEQSAITAATTGSTAAALAAFALHPLVDFATTARTLLSAYRTTHPTLPAPPR